MWFLASLFIFICLLGVCAVLGAALLSRLGIGVNPRSAWGFCLTQTLGCSILMLASGWMSHAGLSMKPWGAIFVTIALALSAAQLRSRCDPDRPGSDRCWPGAVLFCALYAALISLLSLMRDNAFRPYGDTLSSIGLGEYLQDHAFGTIVQPVVQSPIAGIVALFQRTGYRMGVHFLLALVESCVPHARNIDIFPAVTAYGVALAAIGAYAAARRLSRASHRLAAAAAFFSVAGLSLAKYSADFGIMNQLFGLGLFAVGLAEFTVLTASRRAHTLSRWLPFAILTAALISAYSEMVPMYALSLAGVAALRGFGAGRNWRTHLAGYGVATGLILLLGNIEVARAVHAVSLQTRATPGSNINYTPTEFVSSWLGAFPGPSDRGFFTAAAWPVWLRFLYHAVQAAVLGLAAAGLVRLGMRRRALTVSAGLASTLCVFATLAIYFTFFVKNPFLPGHTGNTWSLSKLTMYAVPYGAALLALGAGSTRWLARSFPWFALAAGLLYLPAHDMLSNKRTEYARALTGVEGSPFGAYENFAERVNRLAGVGTVLMIVPPDTPCFHYELAAYYLYPRPLAVSGWNNPTCMYYGHYEGMGYSAPSGPYRLILHSVADPVGGGIPMGAGFLAQSEPMTLQFEFGNGWGYREFATDGWWHWSHGRSEIRVTAAAAQTISLSATIGCAPPASFVRISIDKVEIARPACSSPTLEIPAIGLSAGAHLIEWESLSEKGEPNGTPFILRNLRAAPATATP